ncbi:MULTISPECIES: DUF1661 domain-containing protein [Porphyromonas]
MKNTSEKFFVPARLFFNSRAKPKIFSRHVFCNVICLILRTT